MERKKDNQWREEAQENKEKERLTMQRASRPTTQTDKEKERKR